MLYRSLAIFFIFLLCLGILDAQRITSETTRYHLNNIQTPNTEDTQAPVIKIISPKLNEDRVFRTEKQEMDITLEVSDQSKLRFISVNKDIQTKNATGVYIFTANLLVGENEIKLKAMDEKGNIRELVYAAEYRPPVITLADRINSESVYYALLIGVNEYEDIKLTDLDKPCADAASLQKVLTSNYNFEPENTVVLRNPTRNEIIEQLNVFRDRVKSNDNLLIFYAGHGYWDEEADIGYWLPSDAYKGNPANWFENTTLANQLRGIDSKHTLLISDACFAGSIFKTRAVNMREEQLYDKVYDASSRKAMVSGNLEEVPDESAFIKYLIKSLKQNKDVYYSAQDLYVDLYDAVSNNSTTPPGYGDIQNVGSEGGHFIFLRKEKD